MTLEQWAVKWQVSFPALQDLRASFGHFDTASTPLITGDSEAAVQARVRLAASARGDRLWRNNNGAGKLTNGSFVRWGLANDSAQLNKALKSSDLIGIRRVLIGPADVGSVFGQFASYEVKEAGWHYTGTTHERAQDAWLRLVRGMGGDARFITDAGQL